MVTCVFDRFAMVLLFGVLSLFLIWLHIDFELSVPPLVVLVC